ncbi:MAG TPA: DNA-directed RNA polymerase subunit beta' [bacterium]|nr:DNA-directed RNA polymerase subunit beta' [bacterium]
MTKKETTRLNMASFTKIQIKLASPEKIKEWGTRRVGGQVIYGEVKKPETINYRTFKPEMDGLFCERIFGPTRDWECYCGKYRKLRYKGIICDKCGVEITSSKVRRERMGYIELAAPVAHIWFFKSVPSRIGLVLNLSMKDLEKVLYFAAYIVLDPGDTSLQKCQVISDVEYEEYRDKYGNKFRAGMGAEAIRELLAEVDLESLSKELRKELETANGQKRVKILKRLDMIEGLFKSGNRPEWMILERLPVVPPELRPMVPLDGGRFAVSDLNDLYRRVINRNNRLKKLIELQAPEIIIRNEKRMLQEAVDALIDNGRRNAAVVGSNRRPLKSLSDLLKGKQGRFRQNLLGKRVDYSGRSVIVVNPELRLNQCGLPREMALELFKPFVMRRLVERKFAHNIKNAKRMVERMRSEVWDILEEVIKDYPVMLNRAPTLHRLSIQAFYPVLAKGRAIEIHPMVCPPYNADFDGDQMAVHVPLSLPARAEAELLMASPYNILSPAHGKSLVAPTQDMVIGIYYLTLEDPKAKGSGKIFANYEEALMAYETGELDVHAPIKVRYRGVLRDTTLGRLIFNKVLPEDWDYVNEPQDKKSLGNLIEACFKKKGYTATINLLDAIKGLGFKWATRAGLTISVKDVEIPEDKDKLIKEAMSEVEMLEKQYEDGLLTQEEKYQEVVDLWNRVTDIITEKIKNGMSPFNHIYMMTTSGARGNIQQLRQLAGIRGLMADPSGRIIEFPITHNFREGLSVIEYFISTHGARKGSTDTALRTADSGYLTRRLIDVAQEVIIEEEDCGDTEGVYIYPLKEGNEVLEPLSTRLQYRIAAEEVIDPNTGEIIVRTNETIDDEKAKKIEAAGIERVRVFSVFTCKSKKGVCAKCYGINLATNKIVDVGEAVGVTAAQSIGEPGTQLTLRTFHTGGVAVEDITQGLPRVEELFEARKPKGQAIMSEVEGIVKVDDSKGVTYISIINDNVEKARYQIPFGSRIRVQDGDSVVPGTPLTEGPLNPHEILRIEGVKDVERYLVDEVKKVYISQGVELHDKHIELIVRRMLQKIKVDDPGDTELIIGNLVDINEFEELQEMAIKNGLKPPRGKRILLGITRASLATDSFLAAASFQETTRVLTEAAVKGKIDTLSGLKENVIIGNLIPAGTGFPGYKNLSVEKVEEGEKEEAAMEYFQVM